MGGIFNFVATFGFGTAVATTIGKGIEPRLQLLVIRQQVRLLDAQIQTAHARAGRAARINPVLRG